MSEKTYHPLQLFDAFDAPVPGTFNQRRKVAAAMRTIANQLVRTEASDQQLAVWASQLEAIAADIKHVPQTDTRAASSKLFTGKATTTDVLNMMDYNPVGGASNPIAPQLNWVKHSADGVEAEVCLGLAYQGPPGRIHGGVIAWMMDAVLARALNAQHKIAMTGTLNVRYLAATPLQKTVSLRARVREQDGRKIFVDGEIWHQDKQTVAVEGIWLVPKSMMGR